MNLYSYCGNDPINHVDPSGLFWGFLKKLFKWIFVAIAVIVAVITVVSAPATLLGILGAISAAANAAAQVLNALGYRKAGAIFGLIATITGFGSIIGAKMGIGPFASDGGEIDLTGAFAGAFGGVGALANYFQGKPKRRKRKPNVQSITNTSVNGALARLKGKCLTAVGFKGQDPKGVLKKISRKGQVKYDPKYVGSGAIARGDLGIGERGTIHLGDSFFKDNVGGIVNSKSKKLGLNGELTSAAEARQLVILHELRHIITGRSHATESSAEFNKKIIKDCGF